MATARKLKAAKLPADAVVKPKARLFVADDIRPEESGKVTAIGLYADSVVVMQVDRTAADLKSDIPFAIDRLSLLIMVTGLKGRHRMKLAFGAYAKNAPPGTVTEKEYDFPDERSSVNLIAVFRPLVVKSPGKKTVTVIIDDEHTVKLNFEIRVQSVGTGDPGKLRPTAASPEF